MSKEWGPCMSYFSDYLKRTDHRMITKWMHYFAIYERELARFRGKDISFLEIGVYRGGSIPMWKGYFGPNARLAFVDIDPACRDHAEPATTVEIGDQTDPAFLADVAQKHGPFDVVIDDGGHMMNQQITSFEHLWPHLSDQGLYLVEDTHTSYWPGFGGGFRNEASFIEYAKRLVDKLHSWYTDQDEIFPYHEIARELNAVRFYDSIVVLEKLLKTEPPVSVASQDGRITRSRKALEVRGRTSIFGRIPVPN
ncbi:MAG: class I SAM-dependent methyltransferase [Rhodobacteraceae bacterium]|nr:class I SAM-dependent methyltransferase [Paracoccaceae bacterium]